MSLTATRYTVVFIRTPTKILLGLKKKGPWQGRWGGFGAKLDPEENDITEAAVRHVQQECGLSVSNIEKIGLLQIEYEGDLSLVEVHVFQTQTYHGELRENEEVSPLWHDNSSIPYDKMWPDQSYWLPWMLQNKPFKAYFLYRGEVLILKQRVEEWDPRNSVDERKASTQKHSEIK